MPQELIDGQWLPGKWQEFDQLTCVHCKWDTLDGIEAAREHKSQCPKCAPIYVSPPVRTLLISDRWGNPVEEPAEIEETEE